MRTFCIWLIALTISFVSYAANTTTTTLQVTSSINIVDATDYTITSSTPFSSAGIVNIMNTNKATLIFQNVKPSVVISKWLSNVRINGSAAKDGTNCEVRMYAQGTIILPYSSTLKALSCYSGQNFSGSSSNNYGLGNTGGYMNTLSSAQLNNQIRSFKLKRGYMVTFAVGTGGWGYSRCFIADKEDLELSSLPAVLDGKISSYRIFKWYDAQKKGIANDTSSGTNDALNTSWCYAFGEGENKLPDHECVAHRVHKWWPGIDVLGKKEFTAHMKTDNEPANNSDDTPATVSEVLGYWQDVMRTGMRLCSPSSHDGGYSWLEQFMNEIDARGWRCDILDMHCYWDTNQFPNLKNYYDKYKRPIWISELLWGASWNKNGIFAKTNSWDDNSSSNQTANYNGAKPILDNLNSYEYVERYAWWNSERNCSKVYINGTLTTLGEYYASMNSGIGYQKQYEFIPTVVLKNPYSLVAKNITDTSITLEWKDANGDMMDEIRVQYKKIGDSTWNTIATVARKDKSSNEDQSYTFTANVPEPNKCDFRITDIYEGKEYSAELYNSDETWLANIPTNCEDYYFMFFSDESSSSICWALDGVDVKYAACKTDASAPNQYWQMTKNSNGGYTLRNLSNINYVVRSENSWNFVTSNATSADSKSAYLPEYIQEGDHGYWVVKNIAHNGCYVGLWDNDKQFAAGERLAGNRTLAETDHLRIYAVKKSAYSQKRIDLGFKNMNYRIQNQNFTWGTYSSAVQGSGGANSIPNEWAFSKTFDGWNDTRTIDETIDGNEVKAFNTWAGSFKYAELKQEINDLPNGVYKISADMATTDNYQPSSTWTAVYGAPSNWNHIARAHNISGYGDSTFKNYNLYVTVEDGKLTIGVRSDGTWFKAANISLEYICPINKTDETINAKINLGRALQSIFLNRTNYLAGDTNSDGILDVKDIVIIVNNIENHSPYDYNCDANLDGFINEKDIEQILNTITK